MARKLIITLDDSMKHIHGNTPNIQPLNQQASELSVQPISAKSINLLLLLTTQSTSEPIQQSVH